MNIATFFMKYSRNFFVKILQKIYIKCLITNSSRVKYLRKAGAKIGKNCHISDISMFGSEPYLIEVGDNVYFSGKVLIFTHDGGTMKLYHMGIADKKYDNFGKVKIGNNCFIGADSIILKNVTIGNNCVVGAGAVVSRSVPDNSVAAGVPARVISTVEEYYQKNRHMYDESIGLNPYEKKKYIESKMDVYEERRISFSASKKN